MEELKSKLDGLKSGIEESEETAKERTKLVDRLRSQNEVLELRQRSLEENLRILQDRLDVYTSKNAEFLSKERLKMFSDFNLKNEDQISDLRERIRKLQKELAEKSFELE